MVSSGEASVGLLLGCRTFIRSISALTDTGVGRSPLNETVNVDTDVDSWANLVCRQNLSPFMDVSSGLFPARYDLQHHHIRPSRRLESVLPQIRDRLASCQSTVDQPVDRRTCHIDWLPRMIVSAIHLEIEPSELTFTPTIIDQSCFPFSHRAFRTLCLCYACRIQSTVHKLSGLDQTAD